MCGQPRLHMLNFYKIDIPTYSQHQTIKPTQLNYKAIISIAAWRIQAAIVITISKL